MYRGLTQLFGALLIAILGSQTALADYEAAASYSAGLRGISMIVIVDGDVVFEDYANGGSIDQANQLASGTKSFAGIMAAAAVQDGLLDLDEQVSDTIAEWQGTRREPITVRQLLHLTDGLARRNARRGRAPQYDQAIRVGFAREPDTSFAYSPIPFQIFGELMRRKLDGDPVEYLTRRIFEPIGMEIGGWRRQRDGNPLMASGASLTARDWARFGEFILARGIWNGEALVSAEAFEDLFEGSDINPAYGLSWWLNDPVEPAFARATPPLNTTDFWEHPEFLPDDLVLAAGLGDQRLYVSWERNMIVVRQADGIMGAAMGRRLSWSDVQFWRLMDAPAGTMVEPLEGSTPIRTRAPATAAAPAPITTTPSGFQITPEMMQELRGGVEDEGEAADTDEEGSAEPPN